MSNITLDRSYFDKLFEHMKSIGDSGKSHINSARVDWSTEQQWEKENAVIAHINHEAWVFYTFTKREPRHCCLRHIVTLESARGKGHAQTLLDGMYAEMEARGVERLRFFADKKSVRFYEKRGYTWHGVSKTGLPFFYGNLDKNLITPLPKAQQRYIHGEYEHDKFK